MKAKVLYNYKSRNRHELTLKIGDVIEDVKVVDSSTCSGILNGKQGIFPSDCIDIILEEQLIPPTPRPRRSTDEKQNDSMHTRTLRTTDNEEEPAVEERNIGHIIKNMFSDEEHSVPKPKPRRKNLRCSYEGAAMMPRGKRENNSAEVPELAAMLSSNIHLHKHHHQHTQISHLYAHTYAADNARIESNDRNCSSTMIINTQGIDEATSATTSELVERLLKSINQDSHQKTEFEVTAGYQRGILTEPEFIVHPQFAEVPDFYQGIHLVKNQGKFKSNSGDLASGYLQHLRQDINPDELLEQGKNARFEYVKDRLFEFKMAPEQDILSFESVVENISFGQQSSKVGVLALLAQAGAGKTTCMKRAARAIMQKSDISPASDFQSSEGSRFELVVYRDFKSIDQSAATSLQELLFKGYFEDVKEKKLLYRWIVDNQPKVALFFDGLDQAPWTMKEKDCDKVLGPFDVASTESIMGNLLSRNVLPNVRIIISSREFRASALPWQARPEKVITLIGFSKTDAEKLFNKLVSSDEDRDKHSQLGKKSAAASMENKHSILTKMKDDGADNPWKTLISKSSSMAGFLVTPVFLIFTAIVFVSSSLGPFPSTATGLLSRILIILHSSNIVQQGAQISEIVQKLKGLAHDGMENGFVLFQPKDLLKHKLTPTEVMDLMLGVPKRKYLNQRLFESDFFLFFCHQSIQEFLSACFIVEMKLDDFYSFVKTQIHQERWSIVRQFVFGLIFTCHVEDLVVIDDRSERKKILLQSLTPAVVAVEQYKALELYNSFHEACFGNEEISSLVHSIDLSYTPLGANEVNLLGFIMLRTSNLTSISLRLSLTDNVLDTLSYIIKDHVVKVGIVDVRGNFLSVSILNSFLGHLVIGELKLHCDNITGFNRLLWENIDQLTVRDRFNELSFIKTEDSIIIKSPFLKSASFAVESRQLNFNCESCISFEAFSHITEVDMFLRPSSIIANFEKINSKQYLKADMLQQSLNWKVNGEIPEVILDCTYCSLISRSTLQRIKKLVQNFKVRILDIAVPLDQSKKFMSLKVDGTVINIHICHKMQDPQEIPNFISYIRCAKIPRVVLDCTDRSLISPSTSRRIKKLVQKFQAQNLRLITSFKISAKDFDPLMVNWKDKNLTLVCEFITNISDDERNILKKAAQFSSVILQVLCLDQEMSGSPDCKEIYAWRCVDGSVFEHN